MVVHTWSGTSRQRFYRPRSPGPHCRG